MSELQTKLENIRSLLDAYQMDALWLRLASSFAWATGGKSSYINTASSNGLASLLITRDRRYVITNNIEKPRIAVEEGLAEAGWEFMAPEWHTADDPLADLVSGLKVAVDGSAPGMLDLSGLLALAARQPAAGRGRTVPAAGPDLRRRHEQCNPRRRAWHERARNCLPAGI